MQPRSPSRASLLAATLCALACTAASAENFFPTTTAQLIANINTANANGLDDQIDLGGLTFTLTAVNNMTDGPNGLPSITGGGITFFRNGTIERSGAALRLLHIAAGVQVYFDDVVLRGGQAGVGDGGAVFNRGVLTIRTSRLEHNSGTSGGAVYNPDFAVLSVSDSTFQQNSATNGGAIYGGEDVSISVNGSTFSSNMAANGGAIFSLSNGFSVLANCTFSGNQANNHGGAILNDGTIGLIANSTFTNNAAGQFGGGIASLIFGVLPQVRSTILAGNFAEMGGPDLYGTPIAESNNLVGNNSGAAFVAGGPNANGSWVGTAMSPITPGLEALANNGGPSATHALLPASVALDHGSNPQAFEFDQRGTPFPRTIGTITDIGAFEYDPLLFKNGFD